jgi:predicted ribosome quality control (RQC) complex YloA/Tae2 family protein
MKSETIFVEGLNKEVTFWIGLNKEDNDEMIDKASPNDIWVHANNISSCHVICRMTDDNEKIDVNKNNRTKDTKYIVKMGALVCKKNTKVCKSMQKVDYSAYYK